MKELLQKVHFRRPPVILKPFKKKFPHIPTRENYIGEFEEKFWDKFSKKGVKLTPESWIKPNLLEDVARQVGYDDWGNLHAIVRTLTLGADLGCKGSARLGTVGRNSKSVNQYGERLVDSLQQWLEDDLACGPLTKEEVEEHWDLASITVNPMSVRLKPNGKARIIVDMSHPHTDKSALLCAPTPASINSGINKEEFPAYMAGTRDVLTLLYWVGRSGVFCKADWNNAYKHIHVRPHDLCLQFIMLGGRYFLERALVFGCTSSPGLFDRIAKLVIKLAILLAVVPERNSLQCLDDVVYIAERESGHCEAFYRAYREVCSRVGVSLASEEDPDKAFAPCTSGTVLGIEYNIKDWCWRIPDSKVSYMMDTLFDMVEKKSVTMEQCMTLAGRLNHYHILVPGGTWERQWLQGLVDPEAPKQKRIRPSELATSQAQWWITNMANTTNWSAIPDTRPRTPAACLEIYPDAAGGSDTNIRLGLGGCVWAETTICWVYLPWSYRIRSNMKNKAGDCFASKLSMLEAVAGLATVAAHPDLVRNNNVRVSTDNVGFAECFRKGSSSCPYTYSACKALYHIARALNAEILVRWTPRISGPGERVADNLSKGKFAEAFQEASNFSPSPSYIPRTLVAWLENPVKTRLLGQAMVEEMSDYTEVLRWGIEEQVAVNALVVRGKRKSCDI